MGESHYKIRINGKALPVPVADCLLSSAQSSWSGFLTEHHRHNAHSLDAVVCAEKPMLYLVSKGNPLSKWFAGGIWNSAQYRPGAMTLWNKDYPLHQVSFSEPQETLLIELDEKSHLEWVREDFSASPTLPNHVLAEDSQLMLLAQCIQREIASGCKNGKIYGQSLSLALISYIWQRHGNVRLVERTSGPLSAARIRMVCDYIEANIGANITLNELATLVEISPRQLLRAFRQSMGLPPHQYVIRSRIIRAKQMLQEGKHPLSEIALSLGFSSQSHFSASFKKHTGRSPRRY
jgi:AraC family transcriptional regulator